MNKNPSVSLIVPAYNEEEAIKQSVLEDLSVLNDSGLHFEIIIVDDGSRDNTKKIIEENFSGIPTVTLFSKPNGGFGSAVKKGIELSKNDYILFVPVDNPLDQELFKIFLSHLGKADVLTSYRISRKGYSLRMKFVSSVYHILISLFFGLSLKDYNWIHLYDRKIFEKIRIKNDRIFMLAEVLIKAKWLGYSIFEFPVEMKARTTGVKTAASFNAAFRTFIDMFRFFFTHIFNKHTD